VVESGKWSPVLGRLGEFTLTRVLWKMSTFIGEAWAFHTNLGPRMYRYSRRDPFPRHADDVGDDVGSGERERASTYTFLARAMRTRKSFTKFSNGHTSSTPKSAKTSANVRRCAIPFFFGGPFGCALQEHARTIFRHALEWFHCYCVRRWHQLRRGPRGQE
jgi:hypothetical protein